jgi:hypothetical protein
MPVPVPNGTLQTATGHCALARRTDCGPSETVPPASARIEQRVTEMTATGLLTNGKHETGRSGTAPTATETNGTAPRTSGRPETATNEIVP